MVELGLVLALEPHAVLMGSNLGVIAATLTDSLKLAQPPPAICIINNVQRAGRNQTIDGTRADWPLWGSTPHIRTPGR